MNSLKRCMCVINHEIPDRVPVIAQDAQVAAYFCLFLPLLDPAIKDKVKASKIAEPFGIPGSISGIR